MKSESMLINFKYKEQNELSMSRKKINLVASLVGVLNVLFLTNYPVSVAIVLIEVLILVYFYIKKDITKYLGFYLVFLTLSFEFGSLLGLEVFYGFKEFRVAGVNLGVLALLPMLPKIVVKPIRFKFIKHEFPTVYKFCIAIFFMNLTGVFFGLFQILVNDNNIQNMQGYMIEFINISYTMIIIPMLMLLTLLYILSWEKDKIYLIKDFLKAILIGLVSAMIVSRITGSYGIYGGVDTLLAPSIIQYIPFMLIIPFYEPFKKNMDLILLGGIGAILTLLYNSSGKILILYAIVPIGVICILYKRKKIVPLLVILLSIPVLIMSIGQIFTPTVSESILFRSKLNEATSLLRFWEENWLVNMPLSPRTRIEEFLNTIYEFSLKPWYLLFGKGYMGTITDHTGFFSSNFVPGAFTNKQWMNGTFYALHGTINLLFLYHGIYGLLFFIYMAKMIFYNFIKNPWILIGGYWFLFFYGYSVTISTFGIAALFIGLVEVKSHNAKLQTNSNTDFIIKENLNGGRK